MLAIVALAATLGSIRAAASQTADPPPAPGSGEQATATPDDSGPADAPAGVDPGRRYDRALSGDGRWLAVIGDRPPGLAILDAGDLIRVRTIEMRDRKGRPVDAITVHRAPGRDSFILELKGSDEIWEIATDPDAGPFYDGFVHSRETGMVEGLAAQQGLFARRRIVLDEPVSGFAFTPDGRFLIGASQNGRRGLVVNLNVGRIVAELSLAAPADFRQSTFRTLDGRGVMVVPHSGASGATVIDTRTWTPLAN